MAEMRKRTSMSVLEMGRMLGPVSYTHLDVYKRQRYTSFNMTIILTANCDFGTF